MAKWRKWPPKSALAGGMTAKGKQNSRGQGTVIMLAGIRNPADRARDGDGGGASGSSGARWLLQGEWPHFSVECVNRQCSGHVSSEY